MSNNTEFSIKSKNDTCGQSGSNKFFEERVYNKFQEYTEKDILKEEFNIFCNNLNFTDKIRLFCYGNSKNFHNIFTLDEFKTENYVKKSLSILNKTDLTITKENNLNHYKTSKQGLNKLISSFSIFFKNNEYIRNALSNEVREESFDFKTIVKSITGFLLSGDINKDIIRSIDKDSKSVEISFSDITEFDFNLSELFLKDTLNMINILEQTIKEQHNNKLIVRFKDLPDTEKIKIGSQRVENLDKLVEITGIIRQKTEINPRTTELVYLCSNPACSCSENKIRVSQVEEKERTLKSCHKCKSSLELIETKKEDCLFLVLEQEFAERKSSYDTKKIHIRVSADLTAEKFENKLNISSKIKVIGVLKCIEKLLQGGSKSVNKKYLLEANNIINLEAEQDLFISKEETNEFKQFASENKNVMNKLVDMFATEIYGYNEIKTALLLQHINGGLQNERQDTHILLIGDPATAKTKLIDHSVKYSARGVYTSGTSSTSVGLTASVVRDDLTGSSILEPGALPRANEGLAAVDEIDKLGSEEADKLTEALESQQITINKYNISAVIPTKCSFLAGANPKYGKFETNISITKQITFSPAILSRFDLIFILRDDTNKNDENIASHILKNGNEKQVTNEWLKKYLYYCRMNFDPILNESIHNSLLKTYKDLRNSKEFKFNPRHFHGLIRLTCSYAKLSQRNEVTLQDVDNAINLMMYCFESLGVRDSRDIEEAGAGVTTINKVEKYINSKGNLEFTLEELEQEFKDVETKDLKRIIKKLKKNSIIFEPRKDKLMRFNK
jgi:replicative DNA helicase Mcm